MDAEVRELIQKRVKPEAARIIFALDDYLASKEELETPLTDCSRPIIEGREFLKTTIAYMAAVSSAARNGELESKLDYVRREARTTIERSMPYHIDRLTQEFPEIMNGHTPKAN